MHRCIRMHYNAEQAQDIENNKQPTDFDVQLAVGRVK